MARRIAFLFGFIAVVGLASVSADEIYLKGRAPLKKATITAESPKGITVTGGDKYPESDIEGIVFENLGGLVSVEYTQATKAEKNFLDTSKDAKYHAAAYADVKAKYEALAGKITDKRSKTHIEFTIAYLMGMKALEDGSDTKNAIVRLGEFVKANPQSWQLVRSLSMLAKLQEANKDYAGGQDDVRPTREPRRAGRDQAERSVCRWRWRTSGSASSPPRSRSSRSCSRRCRRRARSTAGRSSPRRSACWRSTRPTRGW